MSKPLDPETARFVDDFAAMQVPWGMPHGTGRLYGFLLLSETPVGLDDLVEMLGIAKSSASVSARTLERAGLIRRYGEARSKRVRYAVAENASGLLLAKAALLGSVANMLRTEAPTTLSPPVSARLKRHAAFYQAMRSSIEQRLATSDAGYGEA